MERAWSVLQELGAVDQDDKLTALGKHIVSPYAYAQCLSHI